MNFKDIFWVLFISMVPIIELRGAIPVGASLGLPFYVNYPLATLGNLLPVPFILLLIPHILNFMERFKIFRPIVKWIRKKAMKNSKKIATDSVVSDTDSTTEGNAAPNGKMQRGAFWGLFLFVLLPLPGTGAWTGSLVAATIDMKFWKAVLSALIGVLCAGVVISLISYGIASIFA